MTRQEATQAFFDAVPVVFHSPSITANPIRMKYIQEICWCREQDGSIRFIVGAMDYNENSILRGAPELFTLDIDKSPPGRRCEECTSEA